MRALLPEPTDPNADLDLHAHYARDWTERGGLRVNFVSAVDGAVSVAGKSAGLQTDGDHHVFAALRDLADVVLAGSGTVTTESYTPITFSDKRQAVRARYGFGPTAPVAVLSHSLGHLDPDADLFTQARPDARTIVYTCEQADPQQRRRLERVAEVVSCGQDTVEAARVRADLAGRGLTRILCEGGPTVFADFVHEGAADELCLSLSPLLGGPGPGRITAGDDWTSPAALTLTGLLEDAGALFLRYRLASGTDALAASGAP